MIGKHGLEKLWWIARTESCIGGSIKSRFPIVWHIQIQGSGAVILALTYPNVAMVADSIYFLGEGCNSW